jgi:Tol biopolymer transport system component
VVWELFTLPKTKDSIVHEQIDIVRTRLGQGDPNEKALDQKIIYTRSYGIETHAEGIYFSRPSYSSPPNSSVYYYDFGSEKVEKVATAPLVRYSNFGFSISPDGKWLYYAKQTKDETDIIVVENYR